MNKPAWLSECRAACSWSSGGQFCPGADQQQLDHSAPADEQEDLGSYTVTTCIFRLPIIEAIPICMELNSSTSTVY